MAQRASLASRQALVGGGDQATQPTARAAPRWIRWAPQAAIWWALAYAAVRVWWAVNGPPAFGPLHNDLIAFTGWGAVGLCAAATVVAIALKTAPWWRPFLVAAWAVSAVVVAASAMMLLDAVGGLLPGIGVPFAPMAFASRAGSALMGGLLAASAVAYRRRWRSDCLFCGRAGVRSRPVRLPWWASLAAYVAVAGCVVRLGAQVVAGFETMLLDVSASLLLFEFGFVLAGTVLPLALVQSWGRIFPRWTPLLGGRRVPRWLVLGPAFGIGGAMTGYFGFTLLALVGATLTGTTERMTGSLSPTFFWVAVPAYLVWGLGLLAAATSYYRLTRPLCPECGQ